MVRSLLLPLLFAALINGCGSEPECTATRCPSGSTCSVQQGILHCISGSAGFGGVFLDAGSSPVPGPGPGTEPVVPPDPCQGVPTSGRCLSASRLEQCVVATGSAQPVVQVFQCAAGESCSVSGG